MPAVRVTLLVLSVPCGSGKQGQQGRREKGIRVETLLTQYGPSTAMLAFAVMAAAGFTKGVVGFALPMLAISGIGSLASAETAIAALLLPSLVTNLQQSVRQGVGAARASLLDHWRLLVLMFIVIGLCAQLVVILPDRVLFLILGSMVTVFGAIQLAGLRFSIQPGRRRVAEVATGLVSGFFGGLSGVWGPPVILYLLALGVSKAEHVRVQGIAYLIGSVVLVLSHLWSGLLNRDNLLLSALMIVPAVAGMLLGQAVQDRLDQALFRRAMLAVLVLAGLNLLRRGLV